MSGHLKVSSIQQYLERDIIVSLSLYPSLIIPFEKECEAAFASQNCFPLPALILNAKKDARLLMW